MILLKKHDNLERIDSISEFTKNIDFVIISSNTEYHYDCIIECIKNNISFIVEKPMIIDLNNHTKVNKLLENSDIKSGVGLCERYNKIFENIEKVNIKKIIINRYCKMPSNNNNKLLLYDLAIHDIDILQFMFKEKQLNILNVNYNDNEYNININIDEIEVRLNIGYRDINLDRNYTFIYKDNIIKIFNLLTCRASLQDEHNDFIRLLHNKNNRICNIKESLNILENLIQIDNKSKNNAINLI